MSVERKKKVEKLVRNLIEDRFHRDKPELFGPIKTALTFAYDFEKIAETWKTSPVIRHGSPCPNVHCRDTCALPTLPVDVWNVIVGYLSLVDLVNFSRVSKSCYMLITYADRTEQIAKDVREFEKCKGNFTYSKNTNLNLSINPGRITHNSKSVIEMSKVAPGIHIDKMTIYTYPASISFNWYMGGRFAICDRCYMPKYFTYSDKEFNIKCDCYYKWHDEELPSPDYRYSYIRESIKHYLEDKEVDTLWPTVSRAEHERCLKRFDEVFEE